MDRILKEIALISSRLPTDYDENLFDSGVLDSLGMARLIGLLEDDYGIEFDIDDITPENFQNVRCVAALVERYMVAKA